MKQEMIWKWASVILLCATLIAVSIIVRDHRIAMAQKQSDNLALAISSINALVGDRNMVTQINETLTMNGYPGLKRPLPPIPVQETTVEENTEEE